MRKTESKIRSRQKGSKINNRPLQPKPKIKPGSTAEAIPDGIFRPYTLDYSPIEKSGFLFTERYFDSWDFKNTYKEKKELAIKWLDILKKHSAYKQIFLNETDSIEDLFGALHKETTRLFKNYKWSLYLPYHENGEPTIYYYKYVESVRQLNIPIDRFSNSKDLNLKQAFFMLVKELNRNFHVDFVTNDIFDMCVLESEPPELENFETDTEFEESILNLASYSNGEPAKVEAQIQKQKKFNAQTFRSLCKKIEDEKIKQWLLSAIELLKTPASIHDFDLNAYDLGNEDGEPLTIRQGIFFPYSFNDYAFQQYEDWLNSMSASFGDCDIFKFGMINASRHIPPTHEKGLINLIKFLDKGRTILGYNDK